MDTFTRKNKSKGYLCKLADVEYKKTKPLNSKTEALASAIEKTNSPIEAIGHATDILLLKREAFEHEDEVRAIIYSPSKKGEKAQNGILVPIKSHDLVDSILIDPRAPRELADAFTHYFRDVLGFTKTIEKSRLYNIPIQRRAEFDDGEL